MCTDETAKSKEIVSSENFEYSDKKLHNVKQKINVEKCHKGPMKNIIKKLKEKEKMKAVAGNFFEEWNEITPQTHIRKFEEQPA